MTAMAFPEIIKKSIGELLSDPASRGINNIMGMTMMSWKIRIANAFLPC